MAKPKPEAKHVLFTSDDGYSTNVRLEDCMDDDVFIATQFDGQATPREHGGPARVNIPKLMRGKARSSCAQSSSSEDRLASREVRGYDNTADP